MRPPRPSEASRIHLELPTGRWSYTDEGRGPAVVCLHGLPGSVRDFRWLAPALVARGLRALRVDLPGFGDSAPCAPTLDATAEQVRAGLLALSVEPALIVGHSFGGAVALRLAARWPTLSPHLALVASTGIRRHRNYASAVYGFELARLARRPGVGPLARRALQAGFRRAGFRHDVDDASILRTLELLRNFDFGVQADSWTRVRAPAAVMWSEDDPFIEPEISEDLARRMPEGPRVRFPGGGHNPQKHYAEEIAEALSAWIERDRASVAS